MATSYQTIQGDTWDGIAYKLWGKEELMRLLIQANPDYTDRLIFPAGIVLAVPEVRTTSIPSNLPPWML